MLDTVNFIDIRPAARYTEGDFQGFYVHSVDIGTPDSPAPRKACGHLNDQPADELGTGPGRAVGPGRSRSHAPARRRSRQHLSPRSRKDGTMVEGGARQR